MFGSNLTMTTYPIHSPSLTQWHQMPTLPTPPLKSSSQSVHGSTTSSPPLLSLLIFILTLILRPIVPLLLRIRTLIVFNFDFEFGHHLVLISLIVITIVAVAVVGVWWNLFSSILIAAPRWAYRRVAIWSFAFWCWWRWRFTRSLHIGLMKFWRTNSIWF